MSAKEYSGRVRMNWNAKVNRARDAFLDDYHTTHGHPIGGTEAWKNSDQYRELMQQEPGVGRQP
ncbi:MAG TPA: hypothetical protein VJ777_22920 [Mycobacterium sp.]|nr:hypothetical protein [Mycobacterium sp.]